MSISPFLIISPHCIKSAEPEDTTPASAGIAASLENPGLTMLPGELPDELGGRATGPSWRGRKEEDGRRESQKGERGGWETERERGRGKGEKEHGEREVGKQYSHLHTRQNVRKHCTQLSCSVAHPWPRQHTHTLIADRCTLQTPLFSTSLSLLHHGLDAVRPSPSLALPTPSLALPPIPPSFHPGL